MTHHDAPSDLFDRQPRWAVQLIDVWCEPDNWRRSEKGNWWVRIDGACITLFRRDGVWRWCIAREAYFRPVWSEMVFPTAKEARRDVWERFTHIALAERS
jgi:hypothetical protein